MNFKIRIPKPMWSNIRTKYGFSRKTVALDNKCSVQAIHQFEKGELESTKLRIYYLRMRNYTTRDGVPIDLINAMYEEQKEKWKVKKT